MTARSEAELVTLRKLAHQLAQARKERTTTVHLLAAIATRGGPAAELLRERRLDAESLLKACRSFDDEGPDPLVRALGGAREVGQRGAAQEPGALHLLIALLADRRSAAHRALEASGVDLARLRTAALQIALGVVVARRVPQAKHEPEAAPKAARTDRGALPSPSPPAARTSRPLSDRSSSAPVAVPLFPPLPRGGRPSTPPPPAQEATDEAPPPRAKTSAALPSPPRRAVGPAADDQDRPRAKKHAQGPSLARAAKRPANDPTSAFALDPERVPVLAALGKNLTLAAARGELEPVVRRDAEIERVLDVLGKRSGSSPCLVGPAGVGKTSVAHGVAQRLVQLHHEAPAGSPPRILVEIAASELVAGTGTRGALAERLAAIRQEVRREGPKRIVIFVDELHELVGAAEEAASEIKTALARGEIVIIGTTTREEHKKTIESDPALARRFTTIEIEEPDEADAFLMAKSAASALSAHHRAAFQDEAIASAVSWSVRYLPGRALPDKAIALLDLAGARARRRARPGEAPTIAPPDVAEVVSELSDVPVERLLETDGERMLALERLLAERVVGHEAALSRIATVLRRNAAGLRGRRPIGTFLLLGPTGVGKTETAKAIAEALFHSPDAMTRLDLSEYAEPHAIARLVGAPPGYVGHDAGGQLTEAVRRRPYQVVLLDEIEKAHRDVLEAFLQVFDEGRLTDGRGHRVDFTNTVIVLTSNLGVREAGEARAARSVGFSSARASTRAAADARAERAMIAAARAELPPELYNRIDEVLVFGPLSREHVAEIARRLLDGLAASLEARGVSLDVSPDAIDALLDGGGYEPELGARPMKRAIMRLVEAPIAELILRGELPPNAVALVGTEGGRIVVDALPPRDGAPDPRFATPEARSDAQRQPM